ncbi:chemotaxis protein CheA [Erythrobacter sp.]|uniref:chemotaxis protein CheA n=1 Tax=Erythrobacter sp. TaxID=1042 RepID=UPI001425D886|nr:chemotaxis protein CheA [Erythrobacter sp.]QIQ86607.1 MAG: chemotaxis protein CheA [Erythrobacter sp.]
MNEDDIQQIFFVECEESLEAAEAGLDACRNGTHDDETINAIFRAVHSVKGGAGAFGHLAMQAFTHCFENLLGEIREHKIELTPALVDLMLTALDLLRDHVEAARSGAEAPDDAALIGQLEAAQAGGDGGGVVGEDAPAAPSEQEPEAPQAPEAPSASSGLDDLDALLDELAADPAPAASPEPSPEPEPEPEPVADSAPADGATETGGGAEWLVHIRPHSGAMANGSEPLLWLRELAELGGTCEACDVSAIPALERLLVEEGYFGWTFRMPAHVTREQVADIFDFAGEDVAVAYGEDGLPAVKIPRREAPVDPPGQPTPPLTAERRKPQGASGGSSSPAVGGSQSVRIDLKKLDRLIDGVGELVIAQAMLTQRLADENVAHVEELAMLDTLVRDIQEHAMAFRAQPISAVFGRVPRLLRELAGKTGKHVKLEVTGETTELDKTVIERLSEPMTHLIRNAVDHGIEPAEDRQAAGKDPEGTLSLSAEQKAGRIVIRIGDDGRGIDREKIRAKAVASGIIAEDAQLSDEECCQLVFAPGLSTAKEISNISGRGVGMDVVKQNVKDLGGRITIESEPGKGTTFVLALPLTLAISDGMIVEVGDQSLVIPLTHVIESLRPAADELKGLGTQRQMLNVRGAFVPIVSLGAMTGARDWEADPSKGVLVLVETEGSGRAALLVDAIADQRQFVIKSLDAHYRAVDSVAGATIMGNGQVALIVDVDFLVQSTGAPAPGMAHAA